MIKNQSEMSKHRLDGFVIAVSVRYRKGMPILNALRDVTDDFYLSNNALARVKNAAIKELKSNGDWDYKRPEVV